MYILNCKNLQTVIIIHAQVKTEVPFTYRRQRRGKQIFFFSILHRKTIYELLIVYAVIFYYTHPIDTEMQKEVMKMERFKNLTWYLDKLKGKFRTRLFKVGNHSVQSQGIMKNVANAWSDADPAQDPSTFKCNLYLVRKRLCCTATGVLRKEHSF